MEKIPMTPQGFQALEAELNRLKNQNRHDVIKAIAEARAHGDLSENAEYHAAKERQSFIEGRVMELEDQIGRADVIDISKLSGGSVKFGAMSPTFNSTVCAWTVPARTAISPIAISARIKILLVDGGSMTGDRGGGVGGRAVSGDR